MKVAVFTRSTALGEIEDDINEWLEEERLSPTDILRVEQSQSSNEEGDILIISVWYSIPGPPVEQETHPRTWQDNCPQWKRGGAFCGYHRDWHGPNGECPTSKAQAKNFNAMNTFGSEPSF